MLAVVLSPPYAAFHFLKSKVYLIELFFHDRMSVGTIIEMIYNPFYDHVNQSISLCSCEAFFSSFCNYFSKKKWLTLAAIILSNFLLLCYSWVAKIFNQIVVIICLGMPSLNPNENITCKNCRTQNETRNAHKVLFCWSPFFVFKVQTFQHTPRVFELNHRDNL